METLRSLAKLSSVHASESEISTWVPYWNFFVLRTQRASQLIRVTAALGDTANFPFPCNAHQSLLGSLTGNRSAALSFS